MSQAESKTTLRMKRIIFGLRFLEMRLRFVMVLIVTAFVVGYWSEIENFVERWQRGNINHSLEAADGAVVREIYSCPMHPFVIRHEPGKCPICGMDLVKQAAHAGALRAGEVQVSPQQIFQSDIKIESVGFRLLTRSVRSYAVVEPAEDRMRKIVARFPGRIETMQVNTVGSIVKEGEPLVTIYSPKFMSAIYEYLQVAGKGSGPEGKLSEFSRERLLLAGLTEQQLANYERTRSVGRELTLFAPLSGTVLERNVLVGEVVDEGTVLYSLADLSQVWVQVLVPEHDAFGITEGMSVEVSSDARPGELFYGTVDFISPTVNPENRTVKIRVKVDNQRGELRPGTYVMANIRVPLGNVQVGAQKDKSEGTSKDFTCPMHPEVRSATAGTCPICGMNLIEAPKLLGKKVVGYGCPMHPDELSPNPGVCEVCGCGMEKQYVEREMVLAVPEEAVIDTGTKKIVYVEKSPGLFQARDVVLGERVDNFYPVLSGISEGDQVAARGAFLIDAEVRIRPAAVEASNPAHHH